MKRSGGQQAAVLEWAAKIEFRAPASAFRRPPQKGAGLEEGDFNSGV